MKIKALVVGPIMENCYILYDEQTLEGIIVDPGDEATSILNVVDNLKLHIKYIVNTHLKVIHTPGHTPGGICLVGEGVVMSGDSLFAGSIGRTDFPTGSMTDLISNLKAKILTLDENLTVFPGHGGATTIAYEKQINPYLG